ncbi:unnamed protein product, partial [Mesorhabditis belari]|uniref:DNA polymerase epsilon catalytic subunit n=1 Tax=Mesorhabditis belari TaxID=2138241 RepID=A0AAF3FAH7_9BILA
MDNFDGGKPRNKFDDDDLTAQAVENDVNYGERLERIKANEVIDQRLGIERYTEATEKLGFMINIQPSEYVEEQTKMIIAAVDFYFLEDMNKRYKISYPFRPYFFIATTNGFEHQVAALICKKYGSFIQSEIVEKEDLDLKNHLSGLKKKYIKLSFPSVRELMKVKSDLMPVIRKNRDRIKHSTEFTTLLAKHIGGDKRDVVEGDLLNEINDIREYDVPYHMRVAIDEKLFIGKWYTTRGLGPQRKPTIAAYSGEKLPKMPVVFAFDIETTKLPLKFPDSSFDEIMMISYMINGRGYLIVNRMICSADIEEFEFTPKEEYKGKFKIYNEEDEKALLRRFFDHILQVRPSIIVTYNGDSFDWPFVETRAAVHGFNMEKEIGFAKDSANEYKSRNCAHMDAFRWVKRDSYLPVGSQNLKAVCKAKLRYDPVELDPELMCKMAMEDPQVLASYSVSDAVATYYLYQKYVHPFIFALCTIIPLGPDDVLRKGSGTLCEALLMVEAFHGNIIFPNKFTGSDEMPISHDGKRIESETYVGGHVEALEAGVFRADIPVRFRMNPEMLGELKNESGDTLAKEIKREFGIERSQLTNFDEVIAEVHGMFDQLLEHPSRSENPRIYHLDVGAMYPNIILTNRLQPCAMVDEETCMACVYNTSSSECKRTMPWMWRGEIIPATRGEYQQILQQLEGETFGKPPKPFHQLDKKTRQEIEKKRVQGYSKKVYGRNHETRLEKRETSICQRENPFYVNTVLAFRDRRYEYKELLKKAKTQQDEAEKNHDTNGIKTGKALCVLYESLQLAHKCILNSFYGYVMRKGSRWFSMEMAGIVCHTGANIITEARKLVEKIGKPLELDTDGIWCLLPFSFPENFTFKVTGWKKDKISISYPAAMLNALVHQKFTNDQYHRLQDNGTYAISSENTIYFEVDGPYRCMLLPASKEEGKKLKKRYAVFNFDGSMAELKGFELKRRGELNIIKSFQDGVFRSFLNGKDLESCYKSVARDADKWLNILFSEGVDNTDQELFDLIAENRSMSRKLEDYGEQKSTSISTAKRLAEFLGNDMVKDAGLACQFIISKFPIGAPVTERAIPLAIFQAASSARGTFLRKWTKNQDMTGETDLRLLLDWPYYIERFGSCVQKIITIPAALQGVENPVPRISHPDWLRNKIKSKVDETLQCKLGDFGFTLSKRKATEINANGKRLSTQPNVEDLTLDLCKLTGTQEENKENHPAVKKSKPEADTNGELKKKTQARDGFDAWLGFLKRKWKQGRKDRKQTQQKSTAVEQMLVLSKQRMHNRFWQVLAVEETREPDVFNVWVSIDGQMSKHGVRVERSFYVNQRDKREKGETSKKVLPHRKESLYLYEHRIEEARFEELLTSINSELCTTAVEGVYESQTPLLFRLLIEMGCMCRVNGPAVHTIWPLTSLKMVPLSEAEYLPQGSIRSIFLYKYSQDSRAIWVIFDASTSEAHFVMANKGDMQIPNLEKVYRELHQASCEEFGIRTMKGIREQLTFHIKKVASLREAEREIGKIVKTMKSATARPTILVTQANESRESLIRNVPNLGLFPHVPIHQKAEPSSLFSSIDWQRVTAKRAIQHYFYSFIYLEDYVEWARYMHIPLGNIPPDTAQFAIDLFFARHLTRSGHILWASPSSRPDLGGKELDDTRLVVDWQPLNEDQAILSKPAFCGNVCLELELGAVAVTAVVHRSRLFEAEGADDTVAFDSTAALPSDALAGVQSAISAYDEGAAVDGAFRILKMMLQECIRDIALHSNKRADQVVLALHRWLLLPSSYLFDPAIARSVSILEKKLCLLLATEIERLGGMVVHASPSKIVFCTGKPNLDAARCFTELLIKTLQKNPLFGSIHMRVANEWTSLLWKDHFNYAGLFMDETPKEVEGMEEETPPQNNLIPNSQWRLCNQLPEIGNIQEEFQKIIIGYLILWSKAITAEGNDLTNDAKVEIRSKLLMDEVLPRMFRVVSKLCTEHGDAGKEASNFLITSVCTALGCDSDCDEAIDSMSSQLKRLLDAPLVELKVHSLYIRSLFCTHCNVSVDVDLCEESAWTCSSCEKRHDLDAIDGLIAERLNSLLTAYLVQDHVCMKCKSVRRDILSEYCECTGTYANCLQRDELIGNAEITLLIGDSHAIPQTQAIAQWIVATV